MCVCVWCIGPAMRCKSHPMEPHPPGPAMALPPPFGIGTFPIQQWRCHSASEQPPFNGASASPCLKVLVTSHILAWYHHASLWWHLVSTPPPLGLGLRHATFGLGLGLGTTTRPRPRPRNNHSASASASASDPPLGLGLGLGTAIRPRTRPWMPLPRHAHTHMNTHEHTQSYSRAHAHACTHKR